MSSRKSNLLKYQNITSGVMTSTAVITSDITSIQFLDNIGLQLNWTGSPTGTFAVQISLDHAQDAQGNVTVAGNWISVPVAYLSAGSVITAVTIPTSVGSPVYVDLNQLSAPYIKVVYTNVSGTGTLNGYITGKMV